MYNGLVLSGGGTKGLLQLGFLEALYENKKIEKSNYIFELEKTIIKNNQ
jgi:predicted acylesterase/phospholipase RssA